MSSRRGRDHFLRYFFMAIPGDLEEACDGRRLLTPFWELIRILLCSPGSPLQRPGLSPRSLRVLFAWDELLFRSVADAAQRQEDDPRSGDRRSFDTRSGPLPRQTGLRGQRWKAVPPSG